MAQKKYVTVSVMMTPTLKELVEKQAEIEERSISYIVRKALEIGLRCLNEKQEVKPNH